MGEFGALAAEAEQVRVRYRALNAAKGERAWEIRDYAMGFVGDVGDLQKLIMAKENLRSVDDVDEKLAHELADCLWSVLVIAGNYGIDVEKAFDATMRSLTERIAAEQEAVEHDAAEQRAEIDR
ncbi:MAG TPA: MazG nucleotide pyrophosphohydrolase domain-containing protein [Micromonosporaceae bacterium]|jgi:NTP pyrophosphatase (non-canonical NTP hydrolase)